MLNDESGMKSLIWEKIQELFSNLPDESPEANEAPKAEGEIQVETPDKASM